MVGQTMTILNQQELSRLIGSRGRTGRLGSKKAEKGANMPQNAPVFAISGLTLGKAGRSLSRILGDVKA